MSNIDKRALREAAEKASTDNHTQDEWFHYLRCSTSETVLALLNELEAAEHTAAVDHEAACSLVEENEEVKRKLAAAEKRNAELEGDKSRMMDALHSAVALNSAGISLNDFDECVLRLHEWGALPDYCIALYVDFIHGYVSENKLLDFGYVNDNGAFAARQAEKRNAEINQRNTELTAKIEPMDRQVGELTMWVKRLAHSLRNAKPDSKLHSDAMDYLSRKGLISVEDVLR